MTELFKELDILKMAKGNLYQMSFPCAVLNWWPVQLKEKGDKLHEAIEAYTKSKIITKKQ